MKILESCHLFITPFSPMFLQILTKKTSFWTSDSKPARNFVSFLLAIICINQDSINFDQTPQSFRRHTKDISVVDSGSKFAEYFFQNFPVDSLLSLERFACYLICFLRFLLTLRSEVFLAVDDQSSRTRVKTGNSVGVPFFILEQLSWLSSLFADIKKKFSRSWISQQSDHFFAVFKLLKLTRVQLLEVLCFDSLSVLLPVQLFVYRLRTFQCPLIITPSILQSQLHRYISSLDITTSELCFRLLSAILWSLEFSDIPFGSSVNDSNLLCYILLQSNSDLSCFFRMNKEIKSFPLFELQKYQSSWLDVLSYLPLDLIHLNLKTLHKITSSVSLQVLLKKTNFLKFFAESLQQSAHKEKQHSQQEEEQEGEKEDLRYSSSFLSQIIKTKLLRLSLALATRAKRVFRSLEERHSIFPVLKLSEVPSTDFATLIGVISQEPVLQAMILIFSLYFDDEKEDGKDDEDCHRNPAENSMTHSNINCFFELNKQILQQVHRPEYHETILRFLRGFIIGTVISGTFVGTQYTAVQQFLFSSILSFVMAFPACLSTFSSADSEFTQLKVPPFHKYIFFSKLLGFLLETSFFKRFRDPKQQLSISREHLIETILLSYDQVFSISINNQQNEGNGGRPSPFVKHLEIHHNCLKKLLKTPTLLSPLSQLVWERIRTLNPSLSHFDDMLIKHNIDSNE